MLLFVVLINDPSFSFSSRWKKFSSLLWSQTSNCFSLVAEFHLKCWDVSIIPLQTYPFVVGFPTTPFNSSLQGCFPSSFVTEVGIFFFILLFQWSIFYSFFQRHCDVALFTHHLELWGSCSFHAYPFNRSVVSSLQVLFILSSFPSSFSRSAALIISILFLLYLVLTGVVSISILSLNLLALVVSLVPLF